jgi:hypothetical protein
MLGELTRVCDLPVHILHPRHSACCQPSRGNSVVVSQHAAEPRSAVDRPPVCCWRRAADVCSESDRRVGAFAVVVLDELGR